MKVVAATMPKNGNAIGPYATSNLVCLRQIYLKAFEKCPEADSGKTKPTERDKKQRGDCP
jgi:hypothetical protein